jgi:hypothetical protein
MSARTRRHLAVASVLCVLAVGVALAGPAVGTETDVLANTDHAGTTDDRDIGDRSAPFAQADDEDGEDEDGEDDEGNENTHVINITNTGENVEYTLTAPGLDPVAPYVEVGENAEDAENPDAIRGNTAFGVIGNGAYDTYRFTGPIENVQLDSENIEALEVRIDGESVDPRTLDGEETATETETPAPTTTATATPTATETETATETATATTTTETDTATETTTTATETATATATASETAVPTSASTASPSPTPSATATGSTSATATSGGESGGGGFTLLMYVLIGVVSGLILAASLAYVVRS